MYPSKHPIPEKFDSLWINVDIVTMTGSNAYGLVKNGALAVCGQKIGWVGKQSELPPNLKTGASDVYDGEHGLITPGLVDCHTHLVYAGSRAQEFEMRLQGVSYEEIARQGGGIISTVTG